MPRVTGAAHAYRLLDVGYAISLEQALNLLATSAPERVRPVRGEGATLQIPNPPVSVILGSERLVIGDAPYDAEIAARIFDFGVVSLRVSLVAPPDLEWIDFARFGGAVDSHPEVPRLLEHHARLLFDRIKPAIERPQLSPVREEYVVFRLRDARDSDGTCLTSDGFLSRVDVAPLLLNETRLLAPPARAELLQHRFS
jgi:hypothetical protein